MRFSIRYKRQAVELYEEHTAQRVFQQLAREFPNIPHPTERTLTRWRNQMRLEEHFEQLISVANGILSGLNTAQPNGEDYYALAPPNSLPYSVTRGNLISLLVDNISKSLKQCKDSSLFDCFLEHLEAEEPSCHEIFEYAKSHPMELIDLLKKLVAKKEFKGKCSICEKWPR